jgi:hypothetical protein
MLSLQTIFLPWIVILQRISKATLLYAKSDANTLMQGMWVERNKRGKACSQRLMLDMQSLSSPCWKPPATTIMWLAKLLFSVLKASGNNNHVAEDKDEAAFWGEEEEKEAALCVQVEMPD